jgi:putative oxidoreductase
MNITQNFDLTDGMTLLRLACALFFIPHIYAKFFVPEALGFFVAAGFKPAKTWLYAACIVEIFIAVGLILGIYPVFFGALGAVHLAIAGAAVLKVTGNKWLWNIGGAEYCFFWALACAVVAMEAWRP